jgi:hypothetical protein
MFMAAVFVCVLFLLGTLVLFGRDMLTTLFNFGTVSDLLREKVNALEDRIFRR